MNLLHDCEVKFLVRMPSDVLYSGYYTSAPHATTVSDVSSRLANQVPKQVNDDANQINPSVVVIIIILTVIFFVSGCLHILIRLLARGPRRESSNAVAITALEGQLQHLFHLHDSGVEQAFIDTLPVFLFKAVQGLKEGSDCAVCLCEFQAEDRLRLLPKCSHAFHIDCIDTWLLSHSTCPLCRGSLLHYFSSLPSAGPGYSFESGEESRGTDRDGCEGDGRNFQNQSAEAADVDSSHDELYPKPGEPCFLASNANTNSFIHSGGDDQNSNGFRGSFKVLPIKLGKFRNITDGGRGESGIEAGGSSRDTRRSYSMGSYEYVLDPSNLQVFIAPTPHRRQTANTKLPLTPAHRPAFSECIPDPADIGHSQMTPYPGSFCESIPTLTAMGNRPLSSTGWENGIDIENKLEFQEEGKGGSKSWFRCTRSILPAPTDKLGGSSRRAVSFRMPPPREASPDGTSKLRQISSNGRRSLSDTEVFGCRDASNPGVNSCALMHEIENTENLRSNSEVNSSFAKRTIEWLVGRPKRIVHASSSDQK